MIPDYDELDEDEECSNDEELALDTAHNNLEDSNDDEG